MNGEVRIADAVERAYHEHFEVRPQRASVSFLGVPAIEILRYGAGAKVHYLSLGMSTVPLADPSDTVVDLATAPRGELMLSLTGAADEVWKSLAILAAAPAVEGATYRLGSRLDLAQALVSGSHCTGAVLAKSPLEDIRVDGYADIQVFQLLPATAPELAWARVHGSDALVERWRTSGTALDDLGRHTIQLT